MTEHLAAERGAAPLRFENAPPLAAVRALLAAAGLPVADLDEAGGVAFAAFYAGEELVAVAGLERHGDDALLRSVAVADGHRHTGLGSTLVTRLETQAANAGIARLYLLTETAEHFFRARGYLPTPRSEVPEAIAASPEFAALCPASAVCLSRSLVDPRGSR